MEGQELGSSENLSTAVESVSTTAPQLTGLDKLKADKAFVEKNDAVPPKTTSTAPNSVAKEPVDAPKTVSVGDPAVPVVPFKADFKYKAGGKELEIPEKFRSLMTDKDSEEEVKKLFGQAATLDELKANTATLKKNVAETGAALGQYQSGVQQLRALAQKNDWDTWFQKLNINPEKIYQWVLDKVQYNQLPPEQRAQLDQQRDLRKQAETAQDTVSQVSHREMQLATQVKGMQLDSTLGKADVKSMNDAFDARVGRPGAFKDAIIEHGKAVWALSNYTVDLTPEQAVEDFVKKYGSPSSFAGTTPAAGVASPTAEAPVAAATPSANTQPPVKVIPNVAGRSASPVKQKPKNMEDLKRLRDSAIKEDNASRNPSQGYLAG